MVTQILVGTKGGKPEVVKITKGENLKAEFDKIVLSGGNNFEHIELIDSRRGRIKRKSFQAHIEKPKPLKKKE